MNRVFNKFWSPEPRKDMEIQLKRGKKKRNLTNYIKFSVEIEVSLIN